MGTKLLDFKSSGSIATVLAGGITGDSVRPFIRVGAAFGAFYGDDNADAFLACHNLQKS